MKNLSEKSVVKIKLDESNLEPTLNSIGIDMGQTLTKIAYSRKNKLVLMSFPTKNSNSKVKKIIESEKNNLSIINFTGGKSYDLYKDYSKNYESNLLNEFEANMKGIETLYFIQKKKKLPPILNVSIGTGTSITINIEGYEHIGGTAMGGGLFMGLLKLILKQSDYDEAINLSKKGNRYNLDLKVSDIYNQEDKRVSQIFREYTAASFGKINEDFIKSSLQKEDLINSIICLIGENIGLIANLMAEVKSVKDLVFCGGFLKDNKILKDILSLICKVNGNRAIFLRNSEYSAAIGALYY